MSKLSSHKLAGGAAARWQSRYWTLQGCKFRYHKRPGAPPLKAFDLRQMRGVKIVQGSWRWGPPREMELDFGFRTWRLRAANAEDARRWLTLLDAARLVAGAPLGQDEHDTMDSDDGFDSSPASTMTSGRQTSARGSGAVAQGGRSPTTTPSMNGQPAASDGNPFGLDADQVSLVEDSRNPFSSDLAEGPGPDSSPSRESNFSFDPTPSTSEPVPARTLEPEETKPTSPRSPRMAVLAREMLPSSMQNMIARRSTPTPAKKPPKLPKPPELLSAFEVADRLEVDPDDLEKRFELWLGSGTRGSQASVGTAHFGDNNRATLTCKGLGNALAALWLDIGGEGPSGAIAAWKQGKLPEPQAFADGAEVIIGEYLSHMIVKVDHWVAETDPLAEEVADVASWLLFEAIPELQSFESHASTELKSKPITWRPMIAQFESMLLGEWEGRSCDEVSQRIQDLYASRLMVDPGEEALAVTNVLNARLRVEVWRGHEGASERAGVVLIAALNAVLRCYRSHVRALLGLHLLEQNGVRVRKRDRVKAVLTRIGNKVARKEDSSSTSTSAVSVAAAAAEAVNLAKFCSDACLTSIVARKGCCADALHAFSGAFDREAEQLCQLVAEKHFVAAHRRTLNRMSFSSRREQNQQAVVAGACGAARSFLDELATGAASQASGHICDAVIKVIVLYWLRAFRLKPPTLSRDSVASITIPFTADEAALRQLAARFGAESIWAGRQSSEEPLQPMREVRTMLSDPSEERLSLGTDRLEVVLGRERGNSLVNAVRTAVARLHFIQATP